MLKSQSSVLTKSLLSLNRDLSKLAAQINKAILGYCGEKSMSFPGILAQDVLQKGLDEPGIVDEIFLQLCKHLTGNPNPESEARAWQLMCMCVGTFAPSNDFTNYLLNFLLLSEDAGGNIGDYANYR
jgi:hypothetical protein